MRRVVITGLGIVCPLGLGVDHVWQRLCAGQSGIKRIDEFATDDLASQIAGVIPSGAAADGYYNVDEHINPKDQKKMGRFIQLAMVAAQQAVRDSGINQCNDEAKEDIGVIIGSGIGGIKGLDEGSIIMVERGPKRISPFFVPANLINICAGYISMEYGFKGPNSAIATACASGTHAIGDAARMIAYGSANAMVCGGAEASITRLGLAGFIAARALSTGFNDRPSEASRPYDQLRDGFVMGEGAGSLVLEELTHAQQRGARIYGELIGYGLSGDAYHLTAPPEDGNGGFRAMRMALRDAKINPEQVDYINSHGTSTPLGDEIELRAIHQLFHGHEKQLAVSSTKSSIGHLLGAAGAVEAVFCVKALQDNLMPATLNLHESCENFGINLVPNQVQSKKLNIVMSNSFGFGGTNASIIMRAM